MASMPFSTWYHEEVLITMEATLKLPRLASLFYKDHDAWAADNADLQAINEPGSAPAPSCDEQASPKTSEASASEHATTNADNMDLHPHMIEATSAPASAGHASQGSILASAHLPTGQAKHIADNMDLRQKDTGQQQQKGTHFTSQCNSQEHYTLLREGNTLSEASAHDKQQASSPILSTPTHVTTSPSSLAAAPGSSSIASNLGKCSDLAYIPTPTAASLPSSSSSPDAPIHPSLSATPACHSRLATPATSFSSTKYPFFSAANLQSTAANPPTAPKSSLRASASPWNPLTPYSFHCMLVGSILTPLTSPSPSASYHLQTPNPARQSLAPSFDGDHLGVSAQQLRRCCHHCGQPPHASPAANTPSFGSFPLRGRNEDIQAQVSDVASRQPRKPFECPSRSWFKMKSKFQRPDTDGRDPPRPRSHLPRCKMKDKYC